MLRGGTTALLLTLILWLAAPCLVRAEEAEVRDGSDLEDLMDIEVVTATRRAEPLSMVAGSVMVLDEEDIFRSGASTLPEVLKFVPGVRVVQEDTDKWTVGIRGFNGTLSNKHLVLLDGRPITSPTMTGVFWGNIVPVNTIKRIEVVRGTWTSLWGVDSFCGVINIITKSAEETQGGQGVSTVGSSGVEQILSYSDAFGDSGHYRIFGQTAYKSGTDISGRTDKGASTNWFKNQAGGRVDWENAYTDALSVQGAVASSRINDKAGGTDHFYRPHERNDFSGYGQFVWNRATGLDAGVTFRTAYTRHLERVDDLTGGTNVIDAEIQHDAEAMGRHRWTWGIGSRYFWDDIQSGENTHFSPENRYSLTSNAFINDRITLVPEKLFTTLGVKFDYLGEGALEVQPSARILRKYETAELWAAISRAVRSSTRWQQGGTYRFFYEGDMYTLVNPDHLGTEDFISYEAGYRQEFNEDVSSDITFYINEYDHLATIKFDKPSKTAWLTNSLAGISYGMEAMVDWRYNANLSFQPSISLIYQDIYGRGVNSQPAGESMPEEGLMREYKIWTRSQLTEQIGFDLLFGYAEGPSKRTIPGALILEAHASWKATPALTCELIGRNLGEAREQRPSPRVGPNVEFRLTWDF